MSQGLSCVCDREPLAKPTSVHSNCQPGGRRRGGDRERRERWGRRRRSDLSQSCHSEEAAASIATQGRQTSRCFKPRKERVTHCICKKKKRKKKTNSKFQKNIIITPLFWPHLIQFCHGNHLVTSDYWNRGATCDDSLPTR